MITFFSPSGYEVRKILKVQIIFFIFPMDSSSNAKKFIDDINPSLVLWVKYEYWYYYLNELKRRNIPVLLDFRSLQESSLFLNGMEHFGKKC